MHIAASNQLLVLAAHGRTDELGQHLADILQTLRGAPGCLAYSLQRSSLDEQLWSVRGDWASPHAMQAHFSLPATQDFVDLLGSRLVARIDFASQAHDRAATDG